MVPKSAAILKENSALKLQYILYFSIKFIEKHGGNGLKLFLYQEHKDCQEFQDFSLFMRCECFLLQRHGKHKHPGWSFKNCDVFVVLVK